MTPPPSSVFRRTLWKTLCLPLQTILLTLIFVGSVQAAKIVVMIGEDEYHTWETLPEFAAKDLKAAGHQVTVIQADPQDKNNFPGFVNALRDADLLFVSVRRRTPLKDQLQAVRNHVAAGKPVVGIRTASHAFALLPKTTLEEEHHAIWPTFDTEVLGGNYNGHYGRDEATITLALDAKSHPILKDVAVDKLIAHGGLYKNTPLPKTTKPLLIGTILGQTTEPVAWTNLTGPKQARVFYTSMGHWDDFKIPAFRRFLLNGINWALGK